MQYPLVAYWDSHLLYAILFGAAILTMLAMNSLHLVTAFWNKPGVWVRVVSICGGYAFTMFVSLILILSLDSARVLHYYGGDAGGSAGLLIVPSVVFYSVFGVVIGGIAAIVRRFRASGPTSRMRRTPR
jgi:hypothetical protein